jgi:hypothetical protein
VTFENIVKLFVLDDILVDRLCNLVVRVPGCRPRSPGFDSRRYQIFCLAVGLERGPLSLVRINEELLERKVAARFIKLRFTTVRDPPRWPRDTPLSTKVGTKFRQQVAVAQSV